MIKRYSSIAVVLAAFFACQHHPDSTRKTVKDSAGSHAAMGVDPSLKALHFDYGKDPACGMPLHAGLLDSTVYKGKLYGFCSKECKDAFLKDPASYLAQIK
jgi:YHS domain-containing protein